MRAQIVRIRGGQLATKAVRLIAETVAQGGLIVFPTETVYGLGCAAFHAEAIARLYALKRRPRDKPLALHLGSRDQIAKYAVIDARARRWIERLLPGPYTLILPAKPEAPKVAVQDGKVGVRVPANRSFQLIAAAAQEALAGTSANLSGQPPATTSEDVLAQFQDEVELIIIADEPCSGRSSTVLDLTSDPPRVLRGTLPPESLDLQEDNRRGR